MNQTDIGLSEYLSDPDYLRMSKRDHQFIIHHLMEVGIRHLFEIHHRMQITEKLERLHDMQRTNQRVNWIT